MFKGALSSLRQVLVCESRFYYKDKVDFKNCDVTNWLTSNCNRHIDQYLKKWRQSDNEVWSVNRV